VPARGAFEYAVLRVVPRVEREEFMNAGVVLHSPAHAFVGCEVALDGQRLAALAPELTAEEVASIRRHLEALAAVAAGDPGAGPVATLPPRERFHYLVAPRSTVIQVSAVHAGVCEDPVAALRHLFEALVVTRPPAAA
jgi:hypothetical protein